MVFNFFKSYVASESYIFYYQIIIRVIAFKTKLVKSWESNEASFYTESLHKLRKRCHKSLNLENCMFSKKNYLTYWKIGRGPRLLTRNYRVKLKLSLKNVLDERSEFNFNRENRTHRSDPMYTWGWFKIWKMFKNPKNLEISPVCEVIHPAENPSPSALLHCHILPGRWFYDATRVYMWTLFGNWQNLVAKIAICSSCAKFLHISAAKINVMGKNKYL